MSHVIANPEFPEIHRSKLGGDQPREQSHAGSTLVPDLSNYNHGMIESYILKPARLSYAHGTSKQMYLSTKKNTVY